MSAFPNEPGAGGDKPPSPVAKAILDLVSAIPGTSEPTSASPTERARAIRLAAALKAGAISGTLALPGGPLSVVTIVPDLVAVWRIQAQMVADIASAFGKTAQLKQEQMIYCLFRHAAAQVARDLIARMGERIVFRTATLHAVEALARRIGIKVTQKVLANSAARWIPVLGSLGVAGYAYYDTAQVAATAIELFEQDFDSDYRS